MKKSNTKKKAPPKGKNPAVLPLPNKALGEALDKAKAKLVEQPKPDFAAAVQVPKDKATLDVVADLLSDDAAKRERARASAKSMVPADRKSKKADFSMMDSIKAKETVTTQIQAASNAAAIAERLKRKKDLAAAATPKPKAEPKPASTDLAIHVNKTGRVCFGKVAAQRLGKVSYMLVLVEGKTLKLEPSAKATESTVEVRDPGKRPYISATKALKQLGFDGSKPLDLVAQPHGNAGFILKVG